MPPRKRGAPGLCPPKFILNKHFDDPSYSPLSITIYYQYYASLNAEG